MNILIKFKQKENVDTSMSIDEIMNHCEQYRKQLISYCSRYFDCEYEYAKDCVQDAYVALFENLNKGIQINDYKAWLYSVVLNYKNKVIKDKIKRNEYEFVDNVEKEMIIENAAVSNPDYLELITTDEMIEKVALRIISQLNEDEKKLYISYYWKHKKLKDIAVEMNVSYGTMRKRHEKLKKKLNKKIEEFNDF